MKDKIYRIILKEYNKTQPSYLFYLGLKAKSISMETLDEFWEIKSKLNF